MRKLALPLIISLVIIDLCALAWITAHTFSFPLLNPAGIVAQKEYALLVLVFALGITVIGTVIVTTFIIVWRYRESNTKAVYKPDHVGSRSMLLLWWVLPSMIIFILAIITWQSTHALDPYKPLSSAVTPIRIQVVALQWKWLFIYPEQHIATVNVVAFPEKTPVTFELTADAPMNSFWIPRLGGQMYAMSGMVTKLHLMADKTGEFAGSTAEISGIGFADMKFTAHSLSDEEFARWVEKVKQSSFTLDHETYDILAKPSEKNKAAFYAPVSQNLYNDIVTKYMHSSDMNM